MNDTADAGPPDFVDVYRRFLELERGQQAELRRVAEPEDTAVTPALYRLFPGQRPDDRHRRLAYLLPWVTHDADAGDFARQLQGAGISETRVLQVARAKAPLDIVQFRRLAMHVKPRADWGKFGEFLWFWNAANKRRLVEDFYLAKFNPAKGAKK